MTRNTEVSPFEEIEHTADRALRVRGATLDELFANAGRGMVALTGAEADPNRSVLHEVDLEAPDVESLLVDWLSELVYLMEYERLVFTEYSLQTTPKRLHAEIRGGPVMGLKTLIKAVTYHNLQVVLLDGGFEATVVFDV
jgi:SHS2 domain-containing protein